jgi:hypothetical protein
MNGVCAPEDGGDSLSVPLAPQFTVAGAMTGACGGLRDMPVLRGLSGYSTPERMGSLDAEQPCRKHSAKRSIARYIRVVG